MQYAPDELDLKRTGRFLRRALLLGCPQCGLGKPFRRWVHMKERCAACGLRFDRHESDYFIGAYLVNLIIAEVIVAGGLVLGILLSWPDVPWNTIKWALLPPAVIMPIVTYPFSKTLWLAIDLIYRPAAPEDYA